MSGFRLYAVLLPPVEVGTAENFDALNVALRSLPVRSWAVVEVRRDAHGTVIVLLVEHETAKIKPLKK